MNGCDIVVIGSLNSDLVATVERFPNAGETLTGRDFVINCGGKGANQAYAAAALGGAVAMVGQVGSDDSGAVQIKNLSSIGVRVASVQRDNNQPTGTAIIEVESSGENRIIIVPGANGTLTADRLEPSLNLLQEAKLLLLQLEIPMETVAEAIRIGKEFGVQIVLDPAPAAPIPDEWCASIDFLTPNLTELGSLTGDRLEEDTPLEQVTQSARRLCDRGVPCVITKLSSRGAIRVTAHDSYHQPAPAVQVVDTTAAGDCFNAAFAVALASDHSEQDAIEFAVAAGSLSVTRRGAQKAMPVRREVLSFMKTKKTS